MPLDSTVTHCIDYYDCSYLFILLLYFVVCSFVVIVWLLGVCFVCCNYIYCFCFVKIVYICVCMILYVCVLR